MSFRRLLNRAACLRRHLKYGGVPRSKVDTSRYADVEFWEDYHSKIGRSTLDHEWFINSAGSVDALLPQVLPLCRPSIERAFRKSLDNRKSHRVPEPNPVDILHIGCGTSTLGIDLAHKLSTSSIGFHIVNVDASRTAIDIMRERYESSSSLSCSNEWKVVDVMKMPFDNASFDLIVEKGMLDAFDCADLGRHRGVGISTVASLCKEIDRVLARHVYAAWLMISDAAPEFRLDRLFDSLPGITGKSKREIWSVTFQTLTDDSQNFEYFLYIVRRRPRFKVHRIDTNGVEVEVGQFIDELEALEVANMYEGRGHHQGYYVRAIDAI